MVATFHVQLQALHNDEKDKEDEEEKMEGQESSLVMKALILKTKNVTKQLLFVHSVVCTHARAHDDVIYSPPSAVKMMSSCALDTRYSSL